eukprot:1804431-Pleurochrysis_carterae.AAC.2
MSTSESPLCERSQLQFRKLPLKSGERTAGRPHRARQGGLRGAAACCRRAGLLQAPLDGGLGAAALQPHAARTNHHPQEGDLAAEPRQPRHVCVASLCEPPPSPRLPHRRPTQNALQLGALSN